MFWRFGFHNGSAIDSLLDKEDVSLEAILDEDDLLQECKSQNTRLNDYFERVDVLHKLLGYVTGQIESEEKGRFKYPYVATEVLCSEIWSIVETCLHEQQQLLVPFWETVIDMSPDEMKAHMVLASHFAKINAVFLTKKPAEMLAFIQAQPNIVERLLRHVETPSIVDMLVRILQLDEQPGGNGVLEWLSSQNLIGRLLDLLSPEHSVDIHTVVADLIKGIVSMATPSANLTEGLQNGPASNLFARELASRDSISKLASYILHEFNPPPGETQKVNVDVDPLSSSNLTTSSPESSISSVVNSVSVIVELIRKNNSDFFEPYLFHTLRTRLIQVQQQLDMQSGDCREALEQAMSEMVDRMGLVYLGPVLEIFSARLDDLQRLLIKPRSLAGPLSTTVGLIAPLTLERYRICELIAELLHCSNMILLNRPASYSSRMYDKDGRLQGGLAGLERLAQVVSHTPGTNLDYEMTDDTADEIEPALELPITGASHDSSSLDSDDDMSSDDEPGSSDDDAMEEIAMYDEPQSQLEFSPFSPPATLSSTATFILSSPLAISPSLTKSNSQGSADALTTPTTDEPLRSPGRSHGSRRSSRRTTMLGSSIDSVIPLGEQLKRRFLDLNILSTLLDLFFEFPWNNFLHSTIYDLLQQVLTANIDRGVNRDLIISGFGDARLMHRIVDGQKRNDIESERPKGVRLGYMGHLTLISEHVVTALERFPPDLRLTIQQFAPDPEWDEYVTGRYDETRRRDARLLGGGKPVVNSTVSRNVARWKVDEDDTVPPGDINPSVKGATRGEFKRASGLTPVKSTADFGPAPMDVMEDDEDDNVNNQGSSRAPHFARYLAQEMHSSDQFGSSSDDDDDEEGGWLSHSTFGLRDPPISTRHSILERRPLGVHDFEDAFNPGVQTTHSGMEDPFNSHDEDGFGPFSDPPISNGSDPFNFSSSFSDEMEDSSFESFGDFGDFQTTEEGELTPTTGSWTFASDSNSPSDFSEGTTEKSIIGDKHTS